MTSTTSAAPPKVPSPALLGTSTNFRPPSTLPSSLVASRTVHSPAPLHSASHTAAPRTYPSHPLPRPASSTQHRSPSRPSAAPHKPRPHTSSRAHGSAPSEAVLPRGSRVRITGNNRTKWDLIGRTGSVRSAQTLGGWHEVQLSDGAIVRVQRNALEVLELAAPDPSALVRIESARRDTHRRPSHSHARPLGVHPDRASMGSVSKKRVKNGGVGFAGSALPGGAPNIANIAKLNLASLRKYRSVYNLNVSKDCSRDELIGAVKRHFEKTKVDESEVISNFIRHIARHGRPPASD